MHGRPNVYLVSLPDFDLATAFILASSNSHDPATQINQGLVIFRSDIPSGTKRQTLSAIRATAADVAQRKGWPTIYVYPW